MNGLTNGMVIERNLQLSKTAFHLHFGHIKKIYDRVFCVNLLSEKKGEEQMLINFYE